MGTVGQPGDPDDLTMDLRAVQRAERMVRLPVGQRPVRPDLELEKPVEPAPVAEPSAPAAGSLRKVSGRVVDEFGTPVPELEITVYHIGFQCDGQLLGVGRTDGDGRYLVEYEHAGVVNLQIRAVGEKVEVTLSKVRHRAAAAEVINLVCPAHVRPNGAEHDRLMRDLEYHVGRGSLADAREDGECRDITLLSRDTGWDARLVALAAHAERLSQETRVPGKALYALLRLGLPAEARLLAGLKPATLDAAFKRAAQAGVASVNGDEIAMAKEALSAYARESRLGSPAAPGTLSTVGDLLARSGLDGEEAQKFDAIVSTHDGTPSQLWAKVHKAGIAPEKVEMLRTQGKLAQLTLNNGPLMSALQDELRDRPMGRAMVERDLHTPEAWREYLSRIGKAEEVVPPAYSGDTAEERLAVYAEDLARKVRISLPTHVVARRAESGEFGLPGAQDAARVLYRAADELDFRFGTTPTRTFLKQHPELLDEAEDRQAAESALLAMHRVYQVTPDDQAMKVMLDAGYTSAYLITSVEKERFVSQYAEKVGGRKFAELIYNKSELVSSVAYNAFAAAQTLASTPVVYAVSPPAQVAQESYQNLVKNFPTMERLFGELDFCECDHCRSVLSPAAYLVDLLSFVDPPDNVWQLIRDSATEPKPYSVLTKRRPDLPLLPLTCENTHTVLPYIDVVNEILEFSVAHEGDDLPAFDVGRDESEDLLAEPQYLITEAYPVLKDAVYPIGLPFDLWLETVRGFLGRLDAPLATVLAQLCRVETLDGAPYGRRDVHREELGLSPAEHTLFANGTTDWHKLYGYPSVATARSELAKAKTLARRLGVSYKDLAELVKTWFVNPQLDALVLLRSLGLDTWDLMRYMNASGVPPLNAAERTAFQTKAGAHLSWLTTSYGNGTFNKIVVLADSDTSCSFDHTTIRFLNSADPIDEVLTRLNLLVRLRRTLGWKLSEVDAALRAFLPAGALGPGLRTALVHLAHLKTLAERLKLGSDTKVALLSLWSAMDKGRYRRLFLSPRMRPEDRAVFDDPYGDYLSDATILLKDHLSAVQGALNLSADDIKLVLGAGFETAPLTLAAVSLLDRHKSLAKGLKHTVADVIALRELSGVNPFASTGDTLRFTELADVLKRAGLKVAQLDYLIRGRFEPAGPLAPRRERVLGLVRTLATETNRIRAEHAVPADGLAFTDEIIGQKLPLVLPADVAATFLGMWVGTTPVSQAFFNANLVAPVGFAAVADYAKLFPAPPPDNDPEAQEAWQRDRRAHLAGLFLPFLQDRLIRTMVETTLAGEFDAAAEPMAALLTELLELDGGPLLPVFMAAAASGFTVTHFDNTGAVLGTGISVTGAVPPGPGGTVSSRLTAVVEVPTPGPYTFTAPPGSVLTLSHLTDPMTATAAGVFPAVELAAGTLYELTVTLPGGGSAQLGVIGENLPAGPAGRLTARPAATVARIAAAHELIRKALLLSGTLELGVEELRHLRARSADFDGWNLSAPAFGPLLRACGFALLRDELRAEGAELIGVFRDARRVPAAGETADDVRAGVLDRIATLTRRPLETVGDAADVLGFDDPADFADERPLAKLWRLLTLAKTLGVTPSTVAAWADPTPDEALAADVRTTLKARFETTAWRATVKPISDRLRQRRRDALVAYLMHRDGFASLEQLFEYFLIDPGTEPVVQTSRLRLAISSMQTFIQRCLMNLEEEVRPAVLSGTQWEWMKRYRVWEANRKIFLWPENWLEPEFRDDKSHLFQALEGELLQGDVSQDAAEDALHRYLTGLDKIARLEIVTTWLQEHELDPGNNVLHVVGRTYNKPNEYFYRRFLSGEWTPWEPIPAQIESDHVVVTVWRDRPYLFWLTFLVRAEEQDGPIDYTSPSPVKHVDVQLNWAEYTNGQWTPTEASDMNAPLTAEVPSNFDARNVFVHASPYADDDEDQVSIYLSLGGDKHQAAQSGSDTYSPVYVVGVAGGYGQPADAIVDTSLYRGFRLLGRNAPVEVLGFGSKPMAPPFTWNGVRGTQYLGSGALTAWYTHQIEQSGSVTTEKKDAKQVLAKGGGFSLVIPPRPVNTTASAEIDSLVRPFFYQDGRHTFFVEPTVTEQVFHEWDDWIVAEPAGPKWEFEDDIVWEEYIPIDPWGPVIDEILEDPLSPLSIHTIKTTETVQDKLLAPAAAVQFGKSFIGAQGAIHG